MRGRALISVRKRNEKNARRNHIAGLMNRIELTVLIQEVIIQYTHSIYNPGAIALFLVGISRRMLIFNI